ncbi:odorant receptor 2a-like [Pieris napi]|uniref:odorant receptor 2a-like n=1 Tax=Pieris napi TaxID=78633 RepID=UPI001FBBF058|nr:odorant receptor 2a-like [Pieris napi]
MSSERIPSIKLLELQPPVNSKENQNPVNLQGMDLSDLQHMSYMLKQLNIDSDSEMGNSVKTDGSLEDLKTLCISILVIVNVFYCCRGGEYLVNSASEVSTAIYDAPWYELPNQYRKDLIFIMSRSQRVAYVTSTSYIKISLKTFIRIMNMTWSFISLITTVYDTK